MSAMFYKNRSFRKDEKFSFYSFSCLVYYELHRFIKILEIMV